MIREKEFKVSVIIPTKNEGVNIKNTVDSLMDKTDRPVEIIVVDDCSQDNCCQFLDRVEYKNIKLITTKGLGAAQARNYGAKFARGDIFVFADAHIFVEDNWLEKLLPNFKLKEVAAVVPGIAPDDNPNNVGYGQTWQENLSIQWFVLKPNKLKTIPLAPGGFLAVRKEVFWDVGGFDTGFRIWGKEDEEFSLKLWLFGYKVFVEPKVKILHVFRKSHPYLVNMEQVHYNLLRMALSHFNQDRIAKIIGMIKGYTYAEKVLSEIMLSDTYLQRQNYFSRRKFSDEWFMKNFNINF